MKTWGQLACAAVRFSLGCVIATTIAGCATQAPTTHGNELPLETPSYQVIDLTPAFWEFWSKANGLPLGEQTKLAMSMLVERYPDVYTAEVIGLDADKPLEEALRTRYEHWLSLISAHVQVMQEVSDKIAADLPGYERSFKSSFPDLRYAGEVYFLCSFGAFDGATRTVRGRRALLFGVDMIAYVYGADADPQPFFHHELFHVYHSQLLPEKDERLYWSLWREGLAAYVAKSLNPSAEGVSLFGLPPDMPDRAQAMLPQLVRELRANLDSTSRDTYAKFFLGKSTHSDVPPRSAYYVGYLVAERIGRGRSLRALARMQGPELRDAIESALQEIEAR